MNPLKIVITGAAGQVAYSLLYQISSGYVFGYDQPLILTLLDIPSKKDSLQGVVMELQDCAMPLIHDLIATDEVEVAFKDVDAAFLVGAMPWTVTQMKQGMERRDLLRENAKIFKTQGEALDKYAKKNVKVLVVGNPANTNAMICSSFAPSIPKQNFSAMTMLDQNRITAQLALKAGVPVTEIKNAISWGNHSSTQLPDVSHATISGKPVSEVIGDEVWIRKTMIPTVQKRGAAVTLARNFGSAMSAAKASCDQMKAWFQGTAPGEYISMGVFSDGSYGIKEDIVFSFPVTIKDGKWTIVKNLELDDFAKNQMAITYKELCDESLEARAVCPA